MRLAVLASGQLGYLTLQSLISRGYQINAIGTDAHSTAIIGLADEMKIPLYKGNPRKGRGKQFLVDSGISVDLLLSINYLFLVEEDLIGFPAIAAVNFHGSLLPKYRGRTPHVWAIINQEKETGITAHLITPGCDEGPIVDQVRFEITPHDTGGSVLLKFQEMYPAFIESVILRFKQGPVTALPQDESKATFFGKRTPEDGRIDWSWQRERIQAWVRAQCAPYPGAFCFYHDQKIILDAIEFSEIGFNFANPDGFILEGGKDPVVKTPNGAIRLTGIRGNTEFRKGDSLV